MILLIILIIIIVIIISIIPIVINIIVVIATIIVVNTFIMIQALQQVEVYSTSSAVCRCFLIFLKNDSNPKDFNQVAKGRGSSSSSIQL